MLEMLALSYSETGEVLLRVVGTLRYVFPSNASVQWQPDGLAIPTKKWFLGAGFLGAPPISLTCYLRPTRSAGPGPGARGPLQCLSTTPSSTTSRTAGFRTLGEIRISTREPRQGQLAAERSACMPPASAAGHT